MPKQKRIRLNTQTFIKKSKEKHGPNIFNYSKVVFKKLKDDVILICNKNGHQYSQRADRHLEGIGCIKCKRRAKTTEQFIKEAKKIHNDKFDYIYVKYENKRTNIVIKCNTCGIIFEQNPQNHLNKCGCPNCTGVLKKTTEQFIKEAILVHGDDYDYTDVEYTARDDYVKIKCNDCNYTFIQMAYHHLYGNGCPKCAGNITKTTEQFIKEAKLIHGDDYDYTYVNYINKKTEVLIKCNECNHTFLQMPRVHKSGSGCPHCLYKTEKLCINIIEEISGLQFFKTRLKILQYLELDGFNEEYKIALEYNGEQHYIYNPHFHRNDIEDLYKQQHRDALKKELCEQNSIYLIVVPYFEPNIKEYIINEYNNYLFLNSFCF
jgi:hypothetical protein